MLGLRDVEWLEAHSDGRSGSGMVGYLPRRISALKFFDIVKNTFRVPDLHHSAFTPGRKIKRVALCGGAGASLIPKAMEAGADCFITGEIHYHDWFECGDMLLAELGHYQSERHAIELLRDIVRDSCPDLKVIVTHTNTDPIRHL